MYTSNAAPSHRLQAFVPKLMTVLHDGYSRPLLRADARAAVMGSATVIPVILALTVQAGVPAQRGLIGAGVALGIAALLGGSSFQISAATVLLCVIASPVIAAYGQVGLALMTAVASAVLIIAAVARWHLWVRYVPAPLMIGLEVGASVLIAYRQLGSALGFRDHLLFSSIEDVVRGIEHHIADVQPASVGVVVGSLCFLIVLRRLAPRWPATLLVLVGASIVTTMWALPVETIGSRLDETVERSFVSGSDFMRGEPDQLISSAFTLAFVIGAQSLRGARVADTHSGLSHRAQGELFAQGMANVAIATLGGLPVSGDPARAVENVRAGAKSPFSAILTGVVVLAAALAVSFCASFVSIANLSAVVLALAWDAGRWSRLRRLLGSSPTDHVLAAVVALALITLGAGAAVVAGIILATVLVLHRRWRETGFRRITLGDATSPALTPRRLLSHGTSTPAFSDVEVFEVRGSLVFESAHQLTRMAPFLERGLRAVILDVQRVTCLDATGREAFEDLVHRCQRHRTILVLAHLAADVRTQLSDCGLLRENRLFVANHVTHAVRIVEAFTGDASVPTRTDGASP